METIDLKSITNQFNTVISINQQFGYQLKLFD